ncbi:MAG: hypothetical protein Q9201_007654 [Fulgogasparrea decipioides]
MSQAKENKPLGRGAYSANLATKFDPSQYGKLTSIGGRSSVASSQNGKSTAIKPKSRQEMINDVLGKPPSSRITKDGKPAANDSSNPAQSSKHNLISPQSHTHQSPRSLADTSSAVSASQAAPFCCSYAGCKRGFQSYKHLRSHKAQEHDYCKVCDEDFEDDEALHKHKIMSEKHITCAVCSMDFRSESGRDRHYTQMHGTAHNLTCKKCDGFFTKGSALLLHFERNLCRPKAKHGINAEDFELQRAEMAMVMQNSSKQAEEGGEAAFLRSLAPKSSVGGSFAGGSFAQSSVGGVPVEPEEQPDFLTDDPYGIRGADFPPLSHPTTERPPSPTESNASTNLLKSEYDPLNASNLAAWNKTNKDAEKTPKASFAGGPAVGKGKSKEEIVEGMSQLSLSAKLLPNTPVTPNAAGYVLPSIAPPSIQPSRSGFTDIGDSSQAIELQPNAITGLWECPYYKCRYKCELRQDLEAHFSDRNNGHRGYENNCPSCLRRFKTASALMAHLESPTIRCKIRESKTFNNVLHVVSGGHLNVDGRYNDGSHRVVAPKDAGKTPEFIW